MINAQRARELTVEGEVFSDFYKMILSKIEREIIEATQEGLTSTSFYTATLSIYTATLSIPEPVLNYLHYQLTLNGFKVKTHGVKHKGEENKNSFTGNIFIDWGWEENVLDVPPKKKFIKDLEDR